MTVREERWPSGKKDEGSGRQKNRHPRKTGAREARKPAGKAKRPSGWQKNGRDDKNGRGETTKPVFALQQAAGWLDGEAAPLAECHPGRERIGWSPRGAPGTSPNRPVYLFRL
jgi:hypothetical protein